jgi:hypothetical protein
MAAVAEELQKLWVAERKARQSLEEKFGERFAATPRIGDKAGTKTRDRKKKPLTSAEVAEEMTRRLERKAAGIG